MVAKAAVVPASGLARLAAVAVARCCWRAQAWWIAAPASSPASDTAPQSNLNSRFSQLSTACTYGPQGRFRLRTSGLDGRNVGGTRAHFIFRQRDASYISFSVPNMFDAVFQVAGEVRQSGFVPAALLHVRREPADQPQTAQHHVGRKQHRGHTAVTALHQGEASFVIDPDQDCHAFGT